MKILVTGGAGFIGSHLVDRLVTEHEVVVLDNLSVGKSEWLNSKAKLIKGSVTDEKAVERAMSGCDVVFHLAAQTDIKKSSEDPKHTYLVNVVGSKNVFRIAEAKGAKVIFVSSAAIYGPKVPACEDDEPQPMSEYGRSKLEAEKLCPKGAFVARLFNVVGPRGRGVVYAFCEAIRTGSGVVISGSGKQTRDFVYVSDVVEALLLGLRYSGIYNVGTGKETSVLDALRIVEDVAGKKANVKFVAAISGELARSVADIRKISRLGWKARYTSEEAVREAARVLLRT